MLRALRVCALGICLVSLTVFGQPNPKNATGTEHASRPIRFIVPFPPGGATDVLARAVGLKVTETWGQQVVVDNRPGAGATIGAEIAAKSAPDGHTILLMSIAHVVNALIHRKLAYDLSRDFSPVILAATSPLILVVHPSMPIASVKSLIALAKSKPASVTYASAGIGTAAHLAAELFSSMAGLELIHVPYRGGAAGLLDLLGGRVSLMFPNMPTALPHIRSARLKPLAVTTVARSLQAPEVPTVAEAGVPGYEVSTWYGVAAPAGTDNEVIAKVNGWISKALSMPDVRAHLSSHGLRIIGGTPEQFSAHIRAEMAKWKKVIKASGIKAE